MMLTTFRKMILGSLLSMGPVVLQAQENALESIVLKGIALHDEGKYPEAIQTYRQALEIDSTSSLVLYEMAYTYSRLEDHEQTITLTEKVLKAGGENRMESYILYGSALDLIGEPEKAIAAYEEGMKEFQHYLLYYNHAMTCRNNGQTDKAIASAQAALNLKFDHSSSHLILSYALEDKGSRIQAILPLYFFLLTEPQSERAGKEYTRLVNLMNQGVEQNGEKNINVKVNLNPDDTWSAAEMSMSLTASLNFLPENKDMDPLQKFSQLNQKLFATLGELEPVDGDFLWETYVPVLSSLEEEGLSEIFSYYLSLSQGEKPEQWIEAHQADMDRLAAFFSENH